MRVNEIFYSLQGEGLYVGAAAVFVRLQGCSMGCKFCDTPKAVDPKGGQDMDPSRVARRAIELAPSRRAHLVITGGEPLLQFESVVKLLELTQTSFVRQELETARATESQLELLVPNFRKLLVTVSPKTDATLEKAIWRICWANETWRNKFALKVLGHKQLPDKADRSIESHIAAGAQGPKDGHLFVQPVWSPEWRASDQAMQDAIRWGEWCKGHPRWRLSIQLHKLLGVP